MQNQTKKLAGIATAGALAFAAMGMAAPAFAATDGHTDVTGQSGTTTVTLKTDPTSTQLAFEGPTEIPFAVAADGTMTGPSADVTTLINKSVFPIHVTNVAVAEQSPFKLVSDVSTGTDANAFQFKMKTGQTNVDAATGQSTKTDANYDLAYAGAADNADTIKVETNDAKLARATVDLSSAQKAATVTWTLAAGTHAAQ